MVQGLGMPDPRKAHGATQVGISEDRETASEHRANGDLWIPRARPGMRAVAPGVIHIDEKLHLLASLLELSEQHVCQAPRPARHEQCLAVTGTLAHGHHLAGIVKHLLRLGMGKMIIQHEPVVDPRQHLHFIECKTELACPLECHTNLLVARSLVVDQRSPERHEQGKLSSLLFR